LYVLYQPTQERDATAFALKAFLDLYFEERGYASLKAHQNDYETIRAEYFVVLCLTSLQMKRLNFFQNDDFVVLEGPPGTARLV